jgi:Flp pilus assembly protein TadG
MLRDRHAYSLTFWAVFIGFVMMPIMALTIELGRYFYARAQISAAADAAALGAAMEINERGFRTTGSLIPTEKTWSQAQAMVNANTGMLAGEGIRPWVTGIDVNDGANTVRVTVSCNLSRLFPAVVPDVMVTQTGLAEVGAFSR